MAIYKVVIVQTVTKEIAVDSSLDSSALKDRIEGYTDQIINENDPDYTTFANWKETWSTKTVTVED